MAHQQFKFWAIQSPVAVKGPAQVSKVKAGKPPVFTGKSSELSPWLTHLKLDFHLQKINSIEFALL